MFYDHVFVLFMTLLVFRLSEMIFGVALNCQDVVITVLMFAGFIYQHIDK